MATVIFPNGQEMPLVGFGTFLAVDPVTLEKALDEALEVGYRLIDTAYFYGNEAIIGRTLKKWFDQRKLKREDIFITTKLTGVAMHPDRVERFLRKSLAALQLEYLDLFLMHSPMGWHYTTDENLFPFKENGETDLDMTTDILAIWKAMEQQADSGLTKSIGISNMNFDQIGKIFATARIKPANLQDITLTARESRLENFYHPNLKPYSNVVVILARSNCGDKLHAYFQQKELRFAVQHLGLTLTAYAALGSLGRQGYMEHMGAKFEGLDLLTNPVVTKIAEKLQKTPAQILLRFIVQQGIDVIPKSLNSERIRQNFQIMDFQLNSSELQLLKALDQGAAKRQFNFLEMKGIEKHPNYPFEKL